MSRSIRLLRQVVLAEIAQTDAVGWHRNPACAATDSPGIAYRDEAGNWRPIHPDFVFFQKVNSEVAASIVDRTATTSKTPP